MKKTILIDSCVTLHRGITSLEGEAVYEQIVAALQAGEDVELDFSDMQMMTTAFLNVVLGDLYKIYTSEYLKEHLSLVNYTEATALRIKKVTDNAKLFYKDAESFQDKIEAVLNGND